MITLTAFSSSLVWLQAEPTGINGFVYHAFNGLAGRWWAFDSFVSLGQDNNLVKAGIIGACFLAAWYGQKTEAETQAARKILITSLVASCLVLAATKAISHVVYLPRPYVLSQKAYHLDSGNLVEYARVDYRVPLDDASREQYRALLAGDIPNNHLGTFPSDHAGFFLTIALGILFASRRVGLIALAWTVFYVLAGKIITGMHTPLDIIAGAAIGVAGFLLCHFLAETRPGLALNKISLWTMKHSAASSAILFVVVFEISSTLDHVAPVVKLLVDAGKRALAIV